MSAKPGKKSASQPAASSPAPAPVPAMAAAGEAAAAPAAWIDSNDPRRKMIGQIVLVGVWIYVAALWLLALDQTFNWGIFGPKVPPVP
jgi:hypothetical protein